MDHDAVLQTLRAMASQEDVYFCGNSYVLQETQHNGVCNPTGQHCLDPDELKGNRDFRSIMVDWAFNLTDFLKFRNETVDYACSCFDRFLQSDLAAEVLHDRALFQLAFVTCVYTAIKCFEPTAMSPRLFSKVSKGAFNAREIERMESVILKAIGWRLNGPTCHAFARQLLDLVPPKFLHETIKDTVYELAKVQMDFCLRDFRFVSVKKSVIALAALMNAFESLQHDDSLGWKIAFEANMAIDSDELTAVQSSLYQVVAGVSQLSCISGKAASASCVEDVQATRVSCHSSPRVTCSQR